MILERIKAGLKKRKVKVFLVFVLFSAFAWFINSLSQSYISTTSFHLDYVNTPDSFLLSEIPKQQINARLKAVGFQFLGFGIRKKKVEIDLSKVGLKDSMYYIAPEVYRKQIENQLPKTITLLELDGDTIFLDIMSVITKEVPVIPRLNLTLAPNYMLEDDIKIEPSTVKIKGPKNEIDTVTSVRTVYIDLLNLDKDFLQKVALIKARELETAFFAPGTVTISGKVFKFSEKIIDVPVTISNIPEGVNVRTFPEVVKVLCQGKLEDLKSIGPEDFVVSGDYDKISDDSDNKLFISIKTSPEKIRNASLLTHEIEFILRRDQ